MSQVVMVIIGAFVVAVASTMIQRCPEFDVRPDKHGNIRSVRKVRRRASVYRRIGYSHWFLVLPRWRKSR